MVGSVLSDKKRRQLLIVFQYNFGSAVSLHNNTFAQHGRYNIERDMRRMINCWDSKIIVCCYADHTLII